MLRCSPTHTTSFLWLSVLLITQVTVAVLGIISAYLQSVPRIPAPPLRFVLLKMLFGEASLLLFYVFPKLFFIIHNVAKCKTDTGVAKCEAAADSAVLQYSSDCLHSATPGESRQLYQPALPEAHCEKITSSTTRNHLVRTTMCNPETSQEMVAARETMSSPKYEGCRCEASASSCPCVLHKESTYSVSSIFGCSIFAWQLIQFSVSRTVVSKYSILAILATLYMTCSSLQNLAPGFVDPAIVQLVFQFTAILTALAQALFFRHPLHWTIWPCAILMFSGAAMVIVPSLGHDLPGSLSTGKGWLGVGLAAIGMVAGVFFYLTLQFLNKSMFSTTYIMFWSVTLSVLIFTALSLPIDGTNWSEQLAEWSAGDWVLLTFSGVSTAAVGIALERATLQLGAATVGLTNGLRLVAAAVLTKPILGTNAVHTGLQIGGVVVVVVSLTAYLASVWVLAKNKRKDALNPSRVSDQA